MNDATLIGSSPPTRRTTDRFGTSRSNFSSSTSRSSCFTFAGSACFGSLRSLRAILSLRNHLASAWWDIPRSLATSRIVFPVSHTTRTAPSRKSGLGGGPCARFRPRDGTSDVRQLQQWRGATFFCLMPGAHSVSPRTPRLPRVRKTVLRLGDAFFRGVPTTGSEVKWAVGTGLVALIILILRAPFAWTSVWAEDGAIFLSGAIKSGFPAFGQFYMGYLHFIPRVGGAMAAALPIQWAAVVMATFAAVVTAAAAGFVEFVSGSQLQRRWVRIGLGLTIPLLTALRVEVIDDMANLQFIVIFVCFWILLWLPRRWLGQIIGMLVLLAITFSTLLATFLVPLALLRLFLNGKRRVLAATFLVGISGHWLLVFAAHAHRTVGAPATFVAGLHAYGSEVIDPLVLGSQFFGQFAQEPPTVLLSLLSLALLIGLVVSVGFCRVDRYRYLAVIGMCLVSSLVVYIGEFLNSSGDAGDASRYAVFPALLLLTAVAMGIDSNTRRGVSFWARAAFVVAILALTCTVNFTPFAYRSLGPRWSSDLAAAKKECVAGAKWVNLPVLPAWLTLPTGWGDANLPCRVITEG